MRHRNHREQRSHRLTDEILPILERLTDSLGNGRRGCTVRPHMVALSAPADRSRRTGNWHRRLLGRPPSLQLSEERHAESCEPPLDRLRGVATGVHHHDWSVHIGLSRRCAIASALGGESEYRSRSARTPTLPPGRQGGEPVGAVARPNYVKGTLQARRPCRDDLTGRGDRTSRSATAAAMSRSRSPRRSRRWQRREGSGGGRDPGAAGGASRRQRVAAQPFIAGGWG